jgi:hypothetical protein
MPYPLPKDEITRYDICFGNVESLFLKICDKLNKDADHKRKRIKLWGPNN